MSEILNYSLWTEIFSQLILKEPLAKESALFPVERILTDIEIKLQFNKIIFIFLISERTEIHLQTR